ncbi:MAG: site-specific integrase [Bryobacteraceae bacterium]|jgi:integrase
MAKRKQTGIRKRIKNGVASWGYYFDAYGSTRKNRHQISEWGFETMDAAIKARAQGMIDEKMAAEKRAASVGVTAPVPKTLQQLFDEFLDHYAEKELRQTTVEKYREKILYLSPELLTMPLKDLEPWFFTREWARLRESGGHHRRTKEPRPLGPKHVRNIRSIASSAFKNALANGYRGTNPVRDSALPRAKVGETRKAIAVAPAHHDLMLAGTSHWIWPTFISVDTALGGRRGETLALRRSDMRRNGRSIIFTIERSLSQTKKFGLTFEPVKTEAGYRSIQVDDPDTIAMFEAHLEHQDKLREQYGTDYRTELDLIFCQPNGELLKPNSVSGSISALCRRLKLPRGVSLHSLRHTYASILIKQGVPITTISAMLGHTDPATTMRIYAHMLPGGESEAAEAFAGWKTKKSKTAKTAPRQHPRETEAISEEEEDLSGTQSQRVRPN